MGNETDLQMIADLMRECIGEIMGSIFESKNEHAVECDPHLFIQALAKMSRTVGHIKGLDESNRNCQPVIEAQFKKLHQYEDLHSDIKKLASVHRVPDTIEGVDRELARLIHIKLEEIEKGA